MEKAREKDLMEINQKHQGLVGSLMVQNKALIEDLKTIARILHTSKYLDSISEHKLLVLKDIVQPYNELEC